ncbi:cytochrome c-type biogenesis protein CcsB [Salinibacterium sp. CAN_S4]|uniref:c-type cytochrome biogenesis protein CcsB n=1 Tax=Salinibacterium sp. CAN_S4 TaxID=2787727 RepID=UPI001A238CD7
MTENFVLYSNIAVYSAMAIYTIAFIMFTLDLSRRSASVAAPAEVGATTRVGQLASAGSTTLLERVEAPAAPPATKGPRYLRAAVVLTAFGWALHVGAAFFRGFAAGRVPWANMFEFTLTATAIIVGVFLLVQFWQDLRFLGAFVVGFSLIALGIATTNFYVDVVPLPPALQSAWLVIHVFVASLGTGFFALGAALSIVQLLQARRAAGRAVGLRFLDTLPAADKLENLAYRLIVVGFVFWTFTLIAGAVWAERAWGRYWGWDTKEVWTFIIWTIFAGYIHARATRGWRGSRSAWLAIIGFGAVVFNFTIVNLFFKGLHSYSGIPGVG